VNLSVGAVLGAIDSQGRLSIKFEDLFFWEFVLPYVNLVTMVTVVAALCAFFVWMTGRKQALVPTGMQNVAESIYGFVRNSIVVDVMGESKAALRYVPYLCTLFTFIFFANLFEIIPPFFFPATSKLAVPLVLALLTWLIFNVQGIISQGFGHYFKGILFPKGVPKPIYLLLTPIELVSVFVLRPLTLMIRLFANLVAGHTIVTLMLLFCWWSVYSIERLPVLIPSFAGAVAMLGFELFVSYIQAFVFTILSAVYIGESIHGH
jgi:F-type H+-transporting ATPase subunit a